MLLDLGGELDPMPVSGCLCHVALQSGVDEI